MVPGAPEVSTGSGTDFKPSQKTSPRSESREKPGIERANPGLRGRRTIFSAL